MRLTCTADIHVLAAEINHLLSLLKRKNNNKIRCTLQSCSCESSWTEVNENTQDNIMNEMIWNERRKDERSESTKKKQQQQPSSLYAKRRHSTSKVFFFVIFSFFRSLKISRLNVNVWNVCVCRLCIRLAFIVSQVEIDANDRVGGWVRQCALSRTHSPSVPHTARIE